MSTRTIAIINSVLCILAFFFAYGVFMASVMGFDRVDAGPAGQMTRFFLMMGVYYFILPAVGLVGGWIGFYLKSRVSVIAFTVLPWFYLLVAVGGLFLTVADRH